ncbi:MAG: hypothetical protein ABMA13_16090 [Chthoniobacteraceae bacterium]
MKTVLLLPEKGIRRCPPRDRAIWLVANIITRDGCFTEVDGYEGYAQWSESAQDWLDIRGMSIRGHDHAELFPLDWIERHERAANAPANEMSIDGRTQYIEHEEWDRSLNGHYVFVELRHRPTCVIVISRLIGPLPTLPLALAVLTRTLGELHLQPEAAQAVAA